MTPLRAIADCLAILQPDSLLYVSAHPSINFSDLGNMRVTTRSDIFCAADLAGETHYDCALVADFLEHIPKARGAALLGQLRNLHASQLLVFIDHARSIEPWTLSDFLALGFHQQETFTDQSCALALYSYDLANYNHQREWNSPKFWANPNMWGRYFW